MAKVSVLDLTVEQVERIELEMGLPINRWREAPSQAALSAKVIAAARGEDEAAYRSLTLRQLTELVDLSGDDDPNR